MGEGDKHNRKGGRAVNRCAARGCGRWVRAGEDLCRRHGLGAEVGGEEDRGGERIAAFRARLAAGDADALVGPELRAGLRGVGADPGVDAEVGALRVALARLLEEEGDASRLAAGIARVAGVAMQAARLRPGGSNEETRATLRRVLAEIDAEMEERRRPEVMGHDAG